jgi:hypothetical protein
MIPGITYVESFISSPSQLYELLITSVKWDERMTARKTASFGQ